MSSEFGNILRVSVFGQSHGDAVGVLMDGLPAGETIDLAELQAFLERRRAKPDGLSTTRAESDTPRFLSGLQNGRTCGFPLCAVLENKNQRSGDYASLENKPRPGHADYTAFVKWRGFADMRGGGHFSGRLTAPLCVAGGIAKQILARRGVYVGAHLRRVGGVSDAPFPVLPTPDLLARVAAKPFPVLDDAAGERMIETIAQARKDCDSVGGVVECAATGFPAGIGGALFGGLESRISFAVFGIPAVKGVEFGEGFHAAELRGSRNNDPFTVRNGTVVTETNHCGGILGGISDGMPLVFRAAFKPTPSIGKPQNTVNLSTMTPDVLAVSGRHDPCVAHRAVPVVEAVTACVLLDALLEQGE
ncbi:MAG: chorismate synthase [Oscillibacter sp.]|nr:chorismate synthase [Oscillibacter sp.]